MLKFFKNILKFALDDIGSLIYSIIAAVVSGFLFPLFVHLVKTEGSIAIIAAIFAGIFAVSFIISSATCALVVLVKGCFKDKKWKKVVYITLSALTVVADILIVAISFAMVV